MVDDLCQRKLKDIADFEWQRYIRPYLTDNDETPPPDGEVGVAPEETRDIVMRCLDQEVAYGYEYTGCNSLPVFTPRSDNYIITITQVSSSVGHFHGTKFWKCVGFQYNEGGADLPLKFVQIYDSQNIFHPLIDSTYICTLTLLRSPLSCIGPLLTPL